jgi:hypothetical protein
MLVVSGSDWGQDAGGAALCGQVLRVLVVMRPEAQRDSLRPIVTMDASDR